jgi:hypothetical protein
VVFIFEDQRRCPQWQLSTHSRITPVIQQRFVEKGVAADYA